MKRRKFIIGALAVLTVPLLPNIQTEPTYEEYVAWFKNKYRCHPETRYHNILITDDLVGLRKDYETNDSLFREYYPNEETWQYVKKINLKHFKVITFEEYKKYIV